MRVTIQKEKVLIKEFAHRDDIRVLVIPAECKKIEYKAFSNCKNLAQVIVESSVDNITTTCHFPNRLITAKFCPTTELMYPN